MEPRPRSFYILSAFFAMFLLFLYGPIITIGILSFQGEGGGLTFPMRGVSLPGFTICSNSRPLVIFGAVSDAALPWVLW